MVTDQLLFYLKMELMSNIFPQRVNVSQCRERTEQEILALEKKRSEESAESAGFSADEVQEVDQEEFAENKMAIKTDHSSIQGYVHRLFEKMKGREGDLLSNLSSPLQRSPLEILMHLQNTVYELEQHEQVPFQQSVLPVDVYLDIERSRRKVEEESLEAEKAQARADYEVQKKSKEDNKELPEGTQQEEQIPKPDRGKDENKDGVETDTVSSYTKEEEIDTKLFNLK